MKWVLVVIIFSSNQPTTYNTEVFDTMTDCFWARELIVDGYLEKDSRGNPINSQAICVRVEDRILPQ